MNNNNNISLNGTSANTRCIQCDTCEKSDVCKFKSEYDKLDSNIIMLLRKIEVEDPFTVEIKCKYYKSIPRLDDFIWRGGVVPCSETDDFPSGLTYRCKDINSSHNSIIKGSEEEPTVKITGNTEVK